MRDNLHCNCHICKVERHLFTSLSEPPGSVQFSTLTFTSPPLAKFTSVSELLGDLHARRNGESTGPLAGELLAALLTSGATIPDFELIHSVLVLAFTPTIHRTYREVRAWFRETRTGRHRAADSRVLSGTNGFDAGRNSQCPLANHAREEPAQECFPLGRKGKPRTPSTRAGNGKECERIKNLSHRVISRVSPS